jgi:PAS domain S-box-containing protein
VKALLLGETDATKPVAERLRARGYDAVRVERAVQMAELAAADDAVIVLFARDGDAERAILDLRAPDAIAHLPLFVATDRATPEGVARLHAAGADEHLTWPAEAALFDARFGAFAERMELRRKLAEAQRIETGLRTSEERLRTLIELATDAIFIKDRGGRYVLLNPAGARVLGRESPEEIIGKTDHEIFSPESARDIIAHDELAMRSRQPIHYDGRRRTIEGDDRVLTTAKFAYVSSEGDLLGIAGITRDTTDSKRAEETANRRKEQRLAHQAALLALAQLDTDDFVAGVERILDTAGDTLGVTRASYWSLRDDPPTVVSHAMRSSGSGSWADGARGEAAEKNGLELRGRDLPRYFETLQQNRVYVVDDALLVAHDREIGRAYLAPNGVRSLLDAPVWLRGSLVGVVCFEAVGAPRAFTTEEQDFAVRVGHTVAMMLGDRERNLAAHELGRSESRMRTLIEHLPDAIFVLREGRFVFVNAAFAAYLGYAASSEVIGARLLDVIHPEDQREGIAIEQGARAPRKVRMLKRDGEAASAEVAGLAMIWDGEPSTVAIARDLTERNRLETQLLLADRMASVGTLAAGVAHEINNPLGYVLGNLTALLHGLGPDGAVGPELRQALTDAIHGAKRVRDIVQDLQTFSRGDASRKSAPVDVLRVMDVSIRMAYSAVKHRARLERDYRPVAAVLGSESRLGQVFLNLIVNAAQAMPERSADENEIKVSVTQDVDEVVVEVQDNGSGMKEETRRRVFDPFFTTKPIGEGTGLGLSICHSIVRSMNGKIEVESEPDVGTTFRVRLPVARAAPTRETIEPPPPSVEERRERVLVIDDEPMIGVMIRRLLAAHCDVLPLTSPREALRRIAANEKFDAILCDLMMPRMSGIEFFTELSAFAPEMAKRTGFLTGGAVTAQARRFVAEHADHTLEKPVELGKLRAFVRMLAQKPETNPAPRR